MRIIDPYYLLTTLTIVVGISVLTYMKFGFVKERSYHVTIIGSKIDSILLAYQLVKLQQPSLNITIIGQFDDQLLSYADSTVQNDKLNMASLYSPYIERKILTFCGTQPLLMKLLEDALLQYKIKRSQTLFNKGASKLSDQQFISETYSINKEKNMLDSVYDYGLSHITAKSIFQKFQTHLQIGINYDSSKMKSIRNILDQIMPNPQKPSSNGVTYLSQIIGLDQKYIRDYISPLVSSSYFHNVNSVATVFKILPLYCKNLETNRRTKNLALLLDEKVLAAKILLRLHEYKNLELKNSKILNIQEYANYTKLFTTQNETVNSINSNMIIQMEDFIKQNQKQISYYRSIIDGIIPYDDQFEQVYTIHFQTPPILSITRLCALDCKNFKNNVYLVISKSKITQKDLTMFAQKQLITNKKMWRARSQIPSTAVKIQQRKNYLRIPDTQLISDNYEMKLIIYKSIAEIVRRQMNQEED